MGFEKYIILYIAYEKNREAGRKNES